VGTSRGGASPPRRGRGVAEQVQRIHPESKVLYMSGYTDDAIVRHDERSPSRPPS